ncbi:MAG: rhodanese-like domain-containing protein [Candidatus Humimicrobiaceae bacterium]
MNGSYNIKLMGSFSSYAGWIIPPESEIIIIAETPSIAHHAFYVLRRMGFDENIYYYQDGVQEWVRSGNEVSMLNLIHPRELQRILEEDNIEVIDVRNAFEHQKGRIGNSINIPDHHIRDRHKKLDKEKKAGNTLFFRAKVFSCLYYFIKAWF